MEKFLTQTRTQIDILSQMNVKGQTLIFHQQKHVKYDVWDFKSKNGTSLNWQRVLFSGHKQKHVVRHVQHTHAHTHTVQHKHTLWCDATPTYELNSACGMERWMI